MLPHDLKVGCGIHSEAFIKVHVMFVIHTDKLYVLRTSVKGNITEETLFVTFVLIWFNMTISSG